MAQVEAHMAAEVVMAMAKAAELLTAVLVTVILVPVIVMGTAVISMALAFRAGRQIGVMAERLSTGARIMAGYPTVTISTEVGEVRTKAGAMATAAEHRIAGVMAKVKVAEMIVMATTAEELITGREAK
jgi:hypothetical protein